MKGRCLFMFIIDMIKAVFYAKKVEKWERKTMLADVRKLPTIENTPCESESKTNDVEINPLFKGKEGLALALLLQANGDESKTNDACDLIKALGLIDDYK